MTTSGAGSTSGCHQTVLTPSSWGSRRPQDTCRYVRAWVCVLTHGGTAWEACWLVAGEASAVQEREAKSVC